MARSLRVAIQMDPIERINIDARLHLRAGAGGAGARPRAVALSAARPGSSADGRAARARAAGAACGASRATTSRWARPRCSTSPTLDVVLMRQDPPFDMAYITATHLLEHIHPKTLVVNDPVEVRNAPEKLFVTHFPELMPPTLITSDRARDPRLPRRARRHHRQAALRQWRRRRVPPPARRREPQRAARDVRPALARAADRPALPAARCARATSASSWSTARRWARSTACRRRARRAPTCMSAAGRRRSTLTDARAARSARRIGPELKARGLIFVGIDVIGDYLTEINVTSPTGLQEISRFDGVAPGGARSGTRSRGRSSRDLP